MSEPVTSTPIPVRDLARRNGWREDVFGTSAEGVPLVAWWPTSTPTRVVWAAIHGEEWTTLMLAHQLLRTVHADDACAVVIPVLNPDGVLGGTRQNARGVDLNRNFPTSNWCAEPSATYWPWTMTRSNEFRTQLSSTGPQPGSEPETQAIMELVQRVQPLAVIDLHTPLDCVIVTRPEAEDLAVHLGEPAGLKIVRELENPTTGDSARWCDDQGALTVTYELESSTPPLLWHRHRDGLVRCIVDRTILI